MTTHSRRRLALRFSMKDILLCLGYLAVLFSLCGSVARLLTLPTGSEVRVRRKPTTDADTKSVAAEHWATERETRAFRDRMDVQVRLAMLSIAIQLAVLFVATMFVLFPRNTRDSARTLADRQAQTSRPLSPLPDETIGLPLTNFVVKTVLVISGGLFALAVVGIMLLFLFLLDYATGLCCFGTFLFVLALVFWLIRTYGLDTSGDEGMR